MHSVTLTNLSKVFPDGTRAVEGVDLAVESGEAVVLLGPSGCGKSTLLRLVAGLEEPTEGDVVISGEIANDLPPRDRGVAMIFQDFALYPHMSVQDNISFPLVVRREPKERAQERVGAIAGGLGLGGLLGRVPAQLSGGQRQRVAMGRALARDPSVFLLDEPLSNLDTVLRHDLRTEMSAAIRRMGITTLYVTHDQTEALSIADRIAVLRRGRLVDLGTPDEVYRRPANTYVATFLGTPRMHLMAAGVEALPDHEVRLYMGAQSLLVPATDFRTRPLAHFHSEQITVGIRSEAVRLVAPDRPAMLQCKVDHVEHLGHESVVYLWTDAAAVAADDPDDGQVNTPRRGGLFARLRSRSGSARAGEADQATDEGRHERPSSHMAARLAPYPGLRPGEPVGVDLDLSRVHFFDRYGQRIDVGL